MVMMMAATVLYAQNQALYDCLYQYDMRGEGKKGKLDETFSCVLRIGENGSKFYDYTSFQLDSVSGLPGVSDDTLLEYRKREDSAENYFDRVLYNDLAAGKMMVYASIIPDRYRYEESLPNINWTLVPGNETICGYVCKKAEGEYQGRRWTVWYAEEVPVPFGPWKLTGLPGLVMKGQDSEGNHTFTAISFRQGEGEIGEEKIPNVVKTSHEKFEKMKNRYDADPMGSIAEESISAITVRKSGGTPQIFINGVRFREHKNGFIPLELFSDK